MSSINPLPKLIESKDFSDHDEYVEFLFNKFLSDINYKLSLFNKPVLCKKYDEVCDMHKTFWHLITEDLEGTFVDEDRYFIMNRAERLLWIPHLINNINSKEIKCWKNKRRGVKNIIIWLESESYMVVLEYRSSNLLLKTAYVHDNKTRFRNIREYKKYGDFR